MKNKNLLIFVTILSISSLSVCSDNGGPVRRVARGTGSAVRTVGEGTGKVVTTGVKGVGKAADTVTGGLLGTIFTGKTPSEREAEKTQNNNENITVYEDYNEDDYTANINDGEYDTEMGDDYSDDYDYEQE